MMEKELFELIHIGDRLTNKEVAPTRRIIIIFAIPSLDGDI